MKKIVLLIMSCTNCFAQSVDIPLEDTSNVEIDTNNGNITLNTTLSSQSIENIYDNQPAESNILYFNGENNCTSCEVEPNQSFDLFWSVENVANCTASNTYNHSDWQGNVEPINGGTGIYSQTIFGGLPENAGTVTFNLNCPSPQIVKYNFEFISQESMKINIPKNSRLILKTHNELLLLFNVMNDSNPIKSKSEIKMIKANDNIYYLNLIAITAQFKTPVFEKILR